MKDMVKLEDVLRCIRGQHSFVADVELFNLIERVLLERYIRKNVGQRQDSLTDQMKDVLQRAVETGCYDAADWIKMAFFEKAKGKL